MKTNELNKGEIVIYKTKEGKTSLDVKLDKETVLVVGGPKQFTEKA
jgi:hypothetical protein